MAARRLILVMIVLLVISSVAAALVPVERANRAESSNASMSTVEESLPSGELRERTIHAGASKPTAVRISLGDQLVLTVTSRGAGEVEIPKLGEVSDVDRDAPARFDLLPFEPGRYAIRFLDSGKSIGWIEVRAERRRPRSGGDA